MNRQTMLFSVIIALLLVVNVIFTHNTLTSLYPGHNDFMSRWEGARSFLVDGLNPYGEEASLNIQERIYGRAIVEGEDPGFFVYPMYTAFLISPLVVVDYAWASAIIMVILEAVMIISILMLIDLFSWKPDMPIVISLILASLFLYYPARGLILGQLGLLVYFFHIMTLWLLHRDYETGAGIVLALSTIKPQMGYLIVPFLLLWGIRAGRRKFVVAFAVFFAILLGASFIALPSWFGDWIEQVRLYPSYTSIYGMDSVVGVITTNYLGLPSAVEVGLAVIFGIFLLREWYMVLIQRKQERFMWTVAMTLTITHLVALRTATPHFVTFSLPLIFYFKHMRKLWVYITLAFLFIFPWVQFFITLNGDVEDVSMFLFAPISMFVVLMLTRKMWWAEPDPFDNHQSAKAVEPVEAMGTA